MDETSHEIQKSAATLDSTPDVSPSDVVRAFQTDIAADNAEFMFAPAGISSISAAKDGKPWQGKIEVNRETADTLNRVLKARLARGEKPYFDFHHHEEDASAWPQEFTFRDTPQPGVYVRAEWSGPGAEAVKSKAVRSFSGAFTLDHYAATSSKPAKINGAPLCMGGLVNDPAFKNNRPLWARHINMNESELAKKIEALETEIETLQAANKAENTEVIRAKAKEIRDLEKQKFDAALAESQATIKAMRQEKADAVIQAAQKRGALPAQPAKDSPEEKIVARYRTLIIDDEANAALVENLPTPSALSPSITAGSSPSVRVLKDDYRGVLKAMAEEKDALKRGIMYAREIRPLVSKDGDSWAPVIRGANTLGTLAGILVVQRSLDLLKYSFPELSAVSTDFSAEPANFNQQITTRLRTVPGVVSYDPVAGYADSAVNDSDVNVTINAHRAVQIVYTANDLASTKRLLFPEQEEGMHFALGLDLVTALLANITAANFPGQPGGGVGTLALAVPGKTTATLDQFARPTVIAMKAALNQRGAMGGKRTLLLDELYHSSLEADTTIVGNLINRDSGDAIANSRLPRIAQFDPYEAPYLPSANNLHGFGFRADALALAARLPNDYSTVFPGVTGGGVVQTVTNPDTGMSVMVVMFLDHKLGQTRFRVALMYGTAVGNPLAGQLLTDK